MYQIEFYPREFMVGNVTFYQVVSHEAGCEPVRAAVVSDVNQAWAKCASLATSRLRGWHQDGFVDYGPSLFAPMPEIGDQSAYRANLYTFGEGKK